MNFSNFELRQIYNYFGLDSDDVYNGAREYMIKDHRSRNMNEWMDTENILFNRLTSHNKKRPRKISNGVIGSEFNLSRIKETLTRSSFMKKWNGVRKILTHFRLNYSKGKFKLGDTANMYKEYMVINNLQIADDDDLALQINDYFNLLKLKWNEQSLIKDNNILNATLRVVFKCNERGYNIVKNLAGLTLDINELVNEISEKNSEYNDDSGDIFYLSAMELIIFYGKYNTNSTLASYGKPRHTKGSIFSPVLFNWNCCLSEIACFLLFRNHEIIKSGQYKFQLKHKWALINVYAVIKDLFPKELKESFFSGDTKQFIMEWNKTQHKLHIILYNSVTSEYFPYFSKEAEFVLFWYPYHVEVFDKLNLPLVRKFKLESQKKKRKEIKYIIYTIDFETYKGDSQGTQIPYLICVYSEMFKYTFKSIMELIDFFKQLTELKQNKYVFWAHNGMKFDYVFILPELVKYFNARLNGKVGELKSIEFGNIKLLDFYKFFNSSLNNLSKAFLGKQKLEFDFNKVFDEETVLKYFDEAQIYCMKDCELLYELVIMFNQKCIEEFQLSINDCFSASHFAKNVFQHHFLNHKLQGSVDEDYDIEKSSYHGGMCMNYYKGYYKGKIYVYDINSSYPYSMLSDMPCEYLSTKDNPKKITSHYLYYVEFEFPEYSRICSLGMKVNNELVFLRKGKGWYWGCELNIAIKLGVKLVKLKVRKYVPKTIFKEYIVNLYEKRIKAKSDNNTILVELYKRLLNSLYGKFGQKLRHKNYIERYDSFLNKELKLNNLKAISDECLYVEYHDNYEYFNSIGSLVRISSYISAKSRCTLLEPILDLNHINVLYMDTDSLFLTCKINDKFINSNELGKFKCEMHDEGIFISAKNYMLDDKCKMKGINAATFNNYLELLQNNQTLIKTTQSSKSFGKVQILEIEKLITNYSFKRFARENYTFPHSSEEDYLLYKKNMLCMKKKQPKLPMSKQIDNSICRDIMNNICSGINIPLILPHKNTYPIKPIESYLKCRIIGYNSKSFSGDEKMILYNELYGIDIGIRQLLLKLYSISDLDVPNWKYKDVGYFKRVLLQLQYKHIQKLFK